MLFTYRDLGQDEFNAVGNELCFLCTDSHAIVKRCVLQALYLNLLKSLDKTYFKSDMKMSVEESKQD